MQAINPLHGGSFSVRDLVQLRCMNMPISIAIVNARLYQSLRVAQSNSAHLVKVAMLVNSTEGLGEGSSSVNELLGKVVQLSVERFNAERCSMCASHRLRLAAPTRTLSQAGRGVRPRAPSVELTCLTLCAHPSPSLLLVSVLVTHRYVCDQAKQELWSLVALGMPERFTVPMGKGIAGTCAQNRTMLNVIDAEHDPRTMKSVSSSSFVMRSTLCMPIFERVSQPAVMSREGRASGESSFDRSKMSTARSLKRLSTGTPRGDQGCCGCRAVRL